MDKSIFNLIPLHPQCRCIALPVIGDEVPVVKEVEPVKISGVRDHLLRSETDLDYVGYRELAKENIKKDYTAIGVAISDEKALATQSAFRSWQKTRYQDIRAVQLGRTTTSRGLKLTPEDIRLAKEEAKLMEEYLSIAPSFKNSETLYRGLSKKKAIFDSFDVGEVIDTKAMASWTSKKSEGLYFARNEGSVLLKTSSKIKGSTSVGNITGNFDEFEVITSGKSKFKIIEKRTIKGTPDMLEVTVEEVE